jgi:hypothetical protein
MHGVLGNRRVHIVHINHTLQTDGVIVHINQSPSVIAVHACALVLFNDIIYCAGLQLLELRFSARS